MNGTEAIINKILADAKEKASAIEQTSLFNQSLRERAYNDWKEEYVKEQKADIKEECRQIIERKVTLAGLDKRKLLLKTKQDVIDSVLELSYQKLCNMKKSDYLAFVLKLICENAQDGEHLLLSKDGVLCKADFEGKLCDKNITVLDELGDFIGGIVLIGKTCDKDLTFMTLLQEQKDKIVSKTVKEIFD